jgi:hypothetical protein
MDKLDYLLWSVALVMQGILSLSVLYMYGGTRSAAEATVAMSALHESLARLEGAATREGSDSRRLIELTRAALYGMQEQIARLRSLYRQAAIIGLLGLCFQGVVIWRLHSRIRGRPPSAP